MNILFCAYDRPGHVATGPNAWIQRLIPELTRGYNLNVTTLFLHSGQPKECPTVNFFKNNNLNIRTLNITKTRYTEDQVMHILTLVKELNIRVVVANLVIPAFYTAKYLSKYNIPVIPVLHSNEPHTKGVISKFINSKETFITHSISVSTLINSYIKAANDQDTHLVIPCGTPNINIEKATFGDSLKVIYAGRIVVEQKQIILLTQAFLTSSKRLPHIDFNIYGDGSYQQQVIELIKKNAPSRVYYKGSVEPSEILNTMVRHNVFTLMSDYEGMPIALMEAMACGLVPVCLFEESGINEIIEDGINGFIVKDRDEDYQKKLKLLQEDKDLWQKMSNNAIKTIKQKYSTEITHKKWADLLASFNTNVTEDVIIPKQIVLKGTPLLYGDIRKPTFFKRIKILLQENWFKLKLAVRPRARFRTLLNKKL
ncbi:glycosyltransferase [Gelidibacter sp. F2691]|nr:glycosyltransferase [Gelidibacter sp. F2691]